MPRLSHHDVDFVPSRVQLTWSGSRGLRPATASTIVSEFGSCPCCGADVDPDVKDAVRVDRDVEWDVELRRSSYHMCPECNSDVRIFAEEKLVGFLSGDRVGDDISDDVFVIDLENGEDVMVIDTFAMNLSEKP